MFPFFKLNHLDAPMLKLLANSDTDYEEEGENITLEEEISTEAMT